MGPRRKRKPSKASPGSEFENKENKRKMAASQPTQGAPQTPQNGQSFSQMLPNMQQMYQPSPPYYMNMLQTSPNMPSSQQIPQNQNNDMMSAMNAILKRLDTMDTKLGQLNSIQVSVNEITERLCEMSRRISEVETSQKFIGDQFDKLSATTNNNKQKITSVDTVVHSLQSENEALRAKTASLTDDVIDLKCRSMRDNLLFFGVSESQTPTQDGLVPPVDLDSVNSTRSATMPAFEDCAERVFDFCATTLKIEDPKSKILIDRAHRIGRFINGKTRPIVVKFKDSSSKHLIQSALKSVDLRNTSFNVKEQYPQEVKDRRKELIPVMIKARSENKKAVLVRDKLYINNRLYTPGNTSSSSST